MTIQLSPRCVYVQKAHFDKQVLILFPFLALSTVVIAMSVEQRFWQTLGLLVLITVTGLMLITRLSHKLRDANLQKLGYVFLAKVLLMLLVLRCGWIPELDPSASNFGYDPQRYYFEANVLATRDFSLAILPSFSLNYTGILFYYGLIFAVLGHNPVIPALVNAFVTLLATLLLVRVGYQIKPQRHPRDWMLGLCMIIPEVVWYDALTSRETLVMSLIVISVLSVAGYLISRPGNRFSLWQAMAAIPAILLIAIIRPPMLIPVVASLLLLARIRMPSRRRLAWFVLFGLTMGIFLLAPFLMQGSGSYQFDYASKLDVAARAEWTRANPQFLWTDRSIGKLFIPDSWPEAILFTPIRLMIYLIAPLPTISIDLTGLLRGSLSSWGRLVELMSVPLYLTLFPLVVASLLQTIRQKKWMDALVFHIPFWLTFIAISMGNSIIHQRYRIMGVPLLWGCMWLGTYM